MTLTERHRSAAADQRAKHQLQDSSLAEGDGDNLETTALPRQTNAQTDCVVRIARRWVTGDHGCAMQASKSSMGGQPAVSALAAIIGNDPGRELARNGSASRFDGPHARRRLNSRPDVLQQFGRQVPRTMRKAPLAGRAWKAEFRSP